MEKISKNYCYGCTACMAICPQHAIEMVENEKGFIEPRINEEKCINCGLCKKVCNKNVIKKSSNQAYIVKLKNIEQQLSSQSGGAAYAISKEIIRKNGSVYAVSMDDNLEAKYDKFNALDDLERTHGSKYMPAKLNNTFQEISEELINNKVLFICTPCQVAGLKKFLSIKNVKEDNLYTVDLICHGTPSVLLWRKMLEYMKEKIGIIKYAKCIDKVQTGWGGSLSTFYGDKKSSNRFFCRIFFTDLALRESCYNCEYTTKERVGDITIGDAWGVKDKNPKLYDSKGVSILLVNNKKGLELFNNCKENLIFSEVNKEEYIQKNMFTQSKPHRSVDEFWNDFNSKDFDFIIEKYGKNNIILNFKYAVKKVGKMLCKRKK